MKIHPELALRKPQGPSTARAKGITRQECGKYFELLAKVLRENNLLNTPQKIFNLDETGLQLNNNPGRVVTNKSAKMVNCISSAEKGETISVITCVNAETVFYHLVAYFREKTKNTNLKMVYHPVVKILLTRKLPTLHLTFFFSVVARNFCSEKSSW